MNVTDEKKQNQMYMRGVKRNEWLRGKIKADYNKKNE